MFKGLRDVELSAPAASQRKRLISEADLATIWVTNPTRRLFGKSGPTKLDIAVYYALVGDFMLPHILGRPVSLVRCPTGRPQDCFFQRHAFTGMPASVATFETDELRRRDRNPISRSRTPRDIWRWRSSASSSSTPGAHCASSSKSPTASSSTSIPARASRWREIVEAAVHIRGELEALGLVPFVKTSGGKGIHVVVPVKPKLGWKAVHQATGEIAARIAAAQPDTFTTTMGKDNRKRRIFIDFHRNARSATAAAPYSLRARTNLPASTPLSWTDLESIDAPEDLNYSSLPGLLADIRRSLGGY